MTRQQASAVVTAPLPTVEQRLRDVPSWASFMVGVERIEKVSHERYMFRISRARRPRDVPVVVRAHPREHRFSWRALAGPAFDGNLHLSATPGGWTRITFTSASRPDGFWANLAELLALAREQAGVDVRLLQDHLVAAGPQHPSVTRATPADPAPAGAPERVQPARPEPGP